MLIYFLLSNLFFSYLVKTPEIKFNETGWNENTNNRYKMIDDLVDSKYLIGKEKGEIKSIFGEPNEVNIHDDFWVYKLVGQTWADFNTIELMLYFEENVIKEVIVIKK